MYLALDIGNTRVKAGLFEDNRLVRHTNWTDASLQDLPGWLEACALEAVMVSDVAADSPGRLDWLRARAKVWELTAHTALPFRNAYRTPETLGKDRVAAVAGAQALFPGRDCLVVDCGTCIKYEWLTAAGVYEGGNIAPGLRMRIQAMHAFTARLPEVELEMPASPIGDSTVTALQNGALRGAVLEINGFIALFRERLPDGLCILSGGDACFLKPFLSEQETILEEHLILYGLHAILLHHVHHSTQE